MRQTHHRTAQLVAAAVEELYQSVGPELLRCAASNLDRSMRIISLGHIRMEEWTAS